MPIFGLVIAQGSHTHRVRFQHTAGLLWGSYTLSNSEAHALFSTSTSRHLSRKSWNTGDSLFFSLISGFPFVAIKYSACKGHTEKQSDSNTAHNLSSFLASCFALEAIKCKDCRYKHTLRNEGLQIQTYNEKQRIADTNIHWETKDCRYKHTMRNKGLQIQTYTEKQRIADTNIHWETKDCRYKHTLRNKGLQIQTYTEKQSV